jgi:hypothetical protein
VLQVARPDHDQAAGISSRQGLVQGCTYQVENRRIGTDTQGEREDGHRRKAKRLSQRAVSVAEVLKEADHICLAARIAILGKCFQQSNFMPF